MQRHHWLAVALVVATVLAFEPVRRHGFVNFDDNLYITENRHVLKGLSAGGFAWAFNVGYASNWHPLTWLSHMLDVSLWGADPGAHHLTNLAMHAASVVVLFFLLRRMTGETGKSAFVAAAFGVHPLHVESVAWIAERKDVLSGLLGLLSLFAWVAWTQKGGSGRYLASIALFALGLAAKPMLVTLPFVLLLLDFWPLRRIARGARAVAEAPAPTAGRTLGALLVEKVPFFVLMALSCVVTLAAQRRDLAIVGATELPIPFRFANAACAYVAYLSKTLWPTKLAFFYPYGEEVSITRSVVSSLVLLGATALLLRGARSRPWLAVGWLWWLGMLVPVIGIVQIGKQSMADRYMYLPLVGLAILAAWGADALLARRSSWKPASTVLACALLGVWIVLTRAQVGTWRDDERLFRHAIAVTEENDLAHRGLGTALAAQGKFEEALSEYQRALEIAPRNGEYHNDVGILFEKQGWLEEAMERYRKALELNPRLIVAQGNLANALDASGRFEEALIEYQKLLELAPERPQAHNDYAVALARQGRFDESLAELSVALRYNPDFGDAYLNQGLTLANMGRLDEAIASVQEGVRLRPDRTDAAAMLEELRRARDQAGSAAPPR